MSKAIVDWAFHYWPSSEGIAPHPLLAHELQVLVMAGDPVATRAVPQWRAVTPTPLGHGPLS